MKLPSNYYDPPEDPTDPAYEYAYDELAKVRDEHLDDLIAQKLRLVHEITDKFGLEDRLARELVDDAWDYLT